ncbi:MAG TPA: secondary thiamine-phosphate synthase enzyme YjbQ [Chloroflexota bacterium]|nr:secondary thiamine-phosphate synthase enzyme YjbQ [Chloroflexota bacterium]
MTELAVAPSLGFWSERVAIRTSGPRQFIDMTEEVSRCIAQAGIRAGLAVVSSLHTTAALFINEHEPELLKDLDRLLTRLAPPGAGYLHNAVPCLPGEMPNGHSHCQSLLLQASVTLPILGGTLDIGRWQRIFFVELDSARDRSVAVTLMGS